MDRNPGSPYIDVEALSDEDSTQSQKLCTDQAEDQRVLTLAEQFLAAMPARIKNDQGEKNFSVPSKGQIISECLFDVFQFSKKPPKNSQESKKWPNHKITAPYSVFNTLNHNLP